MNKEAIIKTLEYEVKKELLEDILPFWINNVKNKKQGGFYGYIDNALNKDETAELGVILCTRILWTYSYAYRRLKDDKYKDMAYYAYSYIMENLWDKEFGGLFWSVTSKGEILVDKKQIYAQAFAIYSLSEFYRATGEEEALRKSREIFILIERYSYDSNVSGYFEACSREWGNLEDIRLSDKDMNEKKSMNTHLHIMEAYTNLYRVWKDKLLYHKLKELIHTTIKYIIDKDSYHFKLFFDESWKVKSQVVSYGHDIEGSWLLHEAAEVLQDLETLQLCRDVSIKMAEVTLQEGIDEDGGLLNEKHENGDLDKDKHWWPQAEAVVGFYNAFELTGKAEFLEAAYKIWNFIRNNQLDKVSGEWFWIAPISGDKYHKSPKVSMWKCPYHNSRMCFEIIERVGKREDRDE
jgi:mannobiose 2-epimerase